MGREQLAVRIRPAPPIAFALVVCVLALSVAGSGDAAGSNTPRCKPEGYGLARQPVPHNNGPHNAVRLTAGWLTGMEGRRSCGLETTIQLTISDAGGVEARARWSVGTVLQPWSYVVHTWVWRNWCKDGQGDATVRFSLPDGTSLRQRVSAPPACVDASAPTTLADVGTGPRYVRLHRDRIPPHILPPGTPPPLHYALIKVTNAWLVSDGYSLVAVYAGSQGNSPSLGRFAVIRQNLIFGIQYEPPDLIDVPKAGALKITRAPHGAAHETSAQRGKLSFSSARGIKGVLDLRTDHVRITASG